MLGKLQPFLKLQSPTTLTSSSDIHCNSSSTLPPPWALPMSSKRVQDWTSSEDDYRAKRTRLDGNNIVPGGNGGVWFPEEEEEKVLLVPDAACFPVLTSSQSDSSSSSGGHSSSPELNRNTSSGSRNPNSLGAAEQQGIELVSLLTSCSESISSGNFEGVNFLLSKLGELASPTGTAIHRLAAYFTEALALRAAKLWPRIFSVSPPTDPVADEGAIVIQMLNYVNPIPKFLHFTANERLLRAFAGNERVHIIDFDIKLGLQWPILLQTLASRPNPPSHVRLTGVGESRQDFQDTAGRLSTLAEALKLLKTRKRKKNKLVALTGRPYL